jgi:EAL domain-containing protein (putative c-di-GMP-specific phosphodiesterase class I)
MGDNGNNTEIVRAVIAMAHDLGMDAVAEGVETVEQLTQLKHLGCNYGQGYLMSRPINPAGIEKLLTERSASVIPQPKPAQSHRVHKKTSIPTRIAVERV